MATVYNMEKKKVGEVELPDAIFSAPVNKVLLHEAVVAHLSNCRQGTVSAAVRSEVRGGGKKPYRQKGTGQARHGSIRSPIFVGGGKSFGPRPRDWHIEMPKKQRKVALRSALSQKNGDGNLFIIDKWFSKDGKTKGMVKVIKAWDMKSGLIVVDESNEKTVRAIRNIPNVKIMCDKDLSVYDVIRHDQLLMTETSAKNVVTRLS